MNKTTVIVPALLRSDEDDALLQRTLHKVPWRADDELILITQVHRPSGWPHAIAPHVQWKHFGNPITKWKAIDVARQEVSPAASKVVFLDADDPYTEDSLREAWERIEEGGFELLIGQRKQIALRATDELSPHSRLYLEIFFNALLLVKLGKEFSGGGQYPDIQSGFYVLSVPSGDGGNPSP